MKFTQILSSTFFVLFACCISNSFAQQTGIVKGKVTGQQSGQPLAGVNVYVKNSTIGTATKTDGSFVLSSIPAGTKTIIFSFVGFKKLSKTVSITAGETTRLEAQLEANQVIMDGIQVTALRPDQIADARLSEADVQQANPRDSGELLRNVEGVDAVRRGPVGLDPVVRGLRETEVGTYLDGTRIFPGGPARMDSPLSHLDPTAIETIEVVKGPYALTWGAGNMSAVRVETQSLSSVNESFGGILASGYDSNLNAIEESASIRGNTGKLGYWLHGAWRGSNNYESGSGESVPADFLSREIRGKAGYALTPNSFVDLSIGYQNQEDIDYPGRLLNADFFNTYNYALNYEWNPDQNLITSIKANAYINNVDHGMDNGKKPTAQPAPNRMPPFALDVKVEARAHVRGGSFSATLNPAESWNLKSGFDIYSANRDATRFIRRRDNNTLLFTDLMWPDATITDAGFYTKADHTFTDRLTTSGTVRLDLVNADADTISQFFAENVSTDLDATETNLSGSFTLSYIPASSWTLGLGIGSVARTADATERYSDRIPASKAQTSAEFVGNPGLDPERSTQADLWISADYTNWNLSINAFVRQMDNYITIAPTDLPKRLPLSSETVFRYINGDAQFWGFDISLSYRLIQELKFNGGLNYLWGEDTRLDEPALGVPPFSMDTGLRYESSRWPLFAEGTVHFVSEQNRVAITRGETPTDGYITADIQTGATFWQRVSLQAGIENIADKSYVNHLNAKNPFTGRQIPEPGRVFHVDVSIRF